MIDTFGMALMDFINDPKSVHVLERDDGYIWTIETSMYYTEYDQWNPIEQELALLIEKSVLDVGCGNGRCMKYFQENGIEAVGIDISPLAIEASKMFRVRNCMVMDALDLKFPENSFDTVALFSNGLGLCGVEGSKKMLHGLSRVVKPKGLMVASSRDPKITTNPSHLVYHEKNRELGKPIGLNRQRVNFNDLKGDWFDFLIFEPSEVEDFIAGTGWSLERIIVSEDPSNAIFGVILRNTN